MERVVAIALGVVMMLATLPALLVAFFAIFLFDAPGSEDSPLTWGLALGLLAAPVVSVTSAVFALLAATKFSAAKMTVAVALPVVLAVYLAAMWWLLDAACGGRFAC